MRVIVSGHRLPSETSETKATTGFAVQLSISSVITFTSGAGAGAKGILISEGFDAVGGIFSSIVYV